MRPPPAGIAAAFADAGVSDEPLSWHLSAVAQQLPPSSWSPPDMAVFARALARPGGATPDRATVRHLCRAAAQVPAEELGREAGVALLTLCMRAGLHDPAAFAHLAEAADPKGAAGALLFAAADSGDDSHRCASRPGLCAGPQTGRLFKPDGAVTDGQPPSRPESNRRFNSESARKQPALQTTTCPRGTTSITEDRANSFSEDRVMGIG